MNPLGGFVTATLGLVILVASRSSAAAAVVAAVCFLTAGQHLDVAGVDMRAIRIILVVASLRVLLKGEWKRVGINSVDRHLMAYALGLLCIASARVGTVSEVIYRVGVCADTLLAYFVFSALVTTKQEVRGLLAKCAVLVVPCAALMLQEYLTGKNPFAMLGGVYADAWVRDGRFRTSGAFRNPITAGSFGATLALLSATALFAFGRARGFIVAVVASLVVVACAGSSGPLLGVGIGMLALASWPLRRRTRQVRWTLYGLLVVLALVMHAPVWFLIDRVAGLVGGGGYHRALLIDRFVNSVGSWWLAGTSDTASWFPYTLQDGKADITNRFVADGVDAGLLGLLLSIALVRSCFRRLEIAGAASRGTDPQTERLLWGIRATLIGNVAILFTVTYFDQMLAIWYLLLAVVARLTQASTAPSHSVAVAGRAPSPPLTGSRWRNEPTANGWTVRSARWNPNWTR